VKGRCLLSLHCVYRVLNIQCLNCNTKRVIDGIVVGSSDRKASDISHFTITFVGVATQTILNLCFFNLLILQLLGFPLNKSISRMLIPFCAPSGIRGYECLLASISGECFMNM